MSAARGELPRSALVLGLARSGLAAALALAGRGARVLAVDRSVDADVGRLREAGVEVHLGTEEGALLDAVDVLIKSPGVPAESPLVALARARGVPVWSEVELGYRLLPEAIVGVTGTNGKTTTTALLGAMLAADGRDVAVAGNVGRPLSGLDGRLSEQTTIVCELSSFQLEDIHEFRPDVAILLNLEPDHLDRHGTLEAYGAAKLRVFENQGTGDVAVVPRGFGSVPGRGRRHEFHADDPLPAQPRIAGGHNRENAAAATVAARALGVREPAIVQALESFPGVEHRLELIGEIGGVRWINDSKATNVAAARRGIAAYEAPLRLILGGSLKGESFAPLADAIADADVRGVYVLGEAAATLAEALGARGVAYESVGDLAKAVEVAAEAAQPGETVLLSPACASYDQYGDFEERGRHFRALVDGLC